MKKLFIFLAVAALMVGCQRSADQGGTSRSTNSMGGSGSSTNR